MGIIKDMDKTLTIKLRSLYGKIFRPSQPQFTLDCEKDKEKIQQIIYDKIIEGKPLMVARMGRTEIDVCENIKYTFHKRRSNWKFICWQGQPNFLNPFLIPNFNKLSGFWPWESTEALEHFYKLICQDMKDVDILGSWCSNQNILPLFELKVLKAVQTLGYKDPNFKDWFAALEYMKKEIDKIDYDICLLGCGAYGFPLAAHCKRMNKQAIHLGGVLQLLFGIKGKRWETDPGYINDYPYAATYYNQYWVRASSDETPTKANEVENGCYW